MTLAEAVAAFEKDFTVHDEVGYVDEKNPEGGCDLTKCPVGDRYVTILSGAEQAAAHVIPVWVHADREDLAIDLWLDEARYYAKGLGTHLWWRTRPEIERADYVALSQVDMIRNERLRGAVSLSLLFVYSRLVITKKE